MCSIGQAVEPIESYPATDDTRVLPRGEVRLRLETARKQVLAPPGAEAGQPLADSASGLLRHLELDRPASLLLDHGRSIPDPPTGTLVVDFQPNEFATSELAVDGQIEHREITPALLELEPDPNRPDVLWLQGALLADQAYFVPGGCVAGVGRVSLRRSWSPPSKPALSTQRPVEIDRQIANPEEALLRRRRSFATEFERSDIYILPVSLQTAVPTNSRTEIERWAGLQCAFCGYIPGDRIEQLGGCAPQVICGD